jgi:D-alanyl-D-alanine carboxypeptidase
MVLRKAMTVLAAFALALPVAPAPAQDANPAQVFAQLSDAELTRRVDAAIAQVVARSEAAGISVAVARGDRIVVDRGAGMANVARNEAADANTIFRIGSVTKQFTAAAIMKLVEQGKLGLDDPLAKYLPDFDTGGRTVTIRQLLNHASGIPNYTAQRAFGGDFAIRPDLTRADILNLVKGVPFDFEPGAGWRYSNTGYYLLGLVIEKVSGRPYPEFLRQELLAPLKLAHTLYDGGTLVPHSATGYTVDPLTRTRTPARALNMIAPFSAGSLASTAGDLLHWQIALTNGRAVSAASFQQMIGSTAKTGRGDALYGFGLVVDTMIGQRHIWHNGGIDGFNSVVSWFPDLGLRTAVISNSEALPSEAVEAMVIQALTSRDPLPPPRTTPQAGTEEALRRVISGISAGQPAYDLMTPALVDVARPQQQQTEALFKAVGPLQSLTFQDVSLNGVDEYVARFEKGALLFGLSLDPQGKIGGMFFRPAGPPPQ